MKNILNNLIIPLFIVLSFPSFGLSQDSLVTELSYEVNRVHPYISITKEKLNKARTIVDLNTHYKPSWIREYILVEILTTNQGRTRTAVSKNKTLSQKQRDIMNMADAGTDISVKIQYIPENTLTYNDKKEINFAFTIDPENEAKYSSGQQQLNEYLKVHAIDKIPDGSFTGYDLAAVKFTVDEEGQIIDVHIFEASKDEKIDEVLVEAICNMPRWQPAEYSNGIKVKQQFVLTVGNMENCIVHLLNIRQN